VATEPAFILVGLTDERRPREVVSALEWAEIGALASDGVSQREISDRGIGPTTAPISTAFSE
jgi:hypothetical protein